MKVKRDAEKTWHSHLTTILIVICDTMLRLFFGSTLESKTGL